jgi:hypothetical protein
MRRNASMLMVEIQIYVAFTVVAVQAHLPASGVRVPRARFAIVWRLRKVETIAKAWRVTKLKRRGMA